MPYASLRPPFVAVLAAVTLGCGIAHADAPGSAAPSADAGSGGGTAPTTKPSDELLARLIAEGASMEEAAKLADPPVTTPAEAVTALKRGNARFYTGEARRPEVAANQRRAQILSQSPFAIIVGCSDSRVPTEIVYDQSLGSLFVIRVAGNIVEPATAGSVEYAVQHLKSRLIVVMGHEGCGAVSAAMLPDEARAKEPANVQFLLDQIRPAVSGVPALRDRKARMREAVIANVRRQSHLMSQNPTVRAAAEAGKVRVVGAYYEIGSGAVDFLETEEELRLGEAEAKQIADQIRQAMPPAKQ